VHFSIEAFRGPVVVKATLSGVNMMLHVRWLLPQPYDVFLVVSTPVFDRELVIIIPFHILGSV